MGAISASVVQESKTASSTLRSVRSLALLERPGRRALHFNVAIRARIRQNTSGGVWLHAKENK